METKVFVDEQILGIEELLKLYIGAKETILELKVDLQESQEDVLELKDDLQESRDELSTVKSDQKIHFSKLLRDVFQECSVEKPQDPTWDRYFQLLNLGGQ